MPTLNCFMMENFLEMPFQIDVRPNKKPKYETMLGAIENIVDIEYFKEVHVFRLWCKNLVDAIQVINVIKVHSPEIEFRLISLELNGVFIENGNFDIISEHS